MKTRMWEAVAVPGRLADLEAAALALVPLAAVGERIEASTDGVSRVVVTITCEGEPPARDAAIDTTMFDRAHAWTFTRLG